MLGEGPWRELFGDGPWRELFGDGPWREAFLEPLLDVEGLGKPRNISPRNERFDKC